MSRAKLHALVRDLRQYLEWQEVGLTETAPAGEEAVRAHVEEKRRRDEQRLQRTLGGGRATEPAPPARATPEKPTRRREERKGAETPALWKDATFDRRPLADRKLSVPWRDDSLPAAEKLAAIRAAIGDCDRCKLCEGRHNIVFGVGNPEARLMFVGEGPGQEEDRQGEPFVGKAGQLLDKMIAAMGLARGDVFIANVVKCRPPNNRDPEPDEVLSCSPFLRQQIAAVQPEVLVALGKFAGNTLTGRSGSLGAIRGRWHEFDGIPLMPTYHPAYLLRNPAGKRDAWNDLQSVMGKLGLSQR